MSAIFISYRRSGAKQTAYRLKDKLKRVFGEDQVFIDLEGIRGGARFADVIPESIAKASVILVMIGPKWLDIGADEGRRRLDEQDDWVRLEVEAALQSKAEVIPVLVDGAAEIDVERLPESMRELTSRNFVEISPKEKHWHFDTDRLIKEIKSADPNLVKKGDDKKLPLSNKAVWSLVLLVLLILGVVSENGDTIDHSLAIGGIALAVMALVLGVWAFHDVQAERVRGRVAASAGIGLSILATLAMVGSLPEPIDATALVEGKIDVSTLPPPAAIPRSVPTIDVAGDWLSTEGLVYRVKQDGLSISFNEYDSDGSLVGNGTGVITGNRIDSEFQSSDEGPGRSQLLVSEDGQRMSGSYQLFSSNESGQTMLFRQ